MLIIRATSILFFGLVCGAFSATSNASQSKNVFSDHVRKPEFISNLKDLIRYNELVITAKLEAQYGSNVDCVLEGRFGFSNFLTCETSIFGTELASDEQKVVVLAENELLSHRNQLPFFAITSIQAARLHLGDLQEEEGSELIQQRARKICSFMGLGDLVHFNTIPVGFYFPNGRLIIDSSSDSIIENYRVGPTGSSKAVFLPRIFSQITCMKE